MAHIRVGVLRGGTSNEYEMSLKVGQHILNMLHMEPLSKKYIGVDILVDKQGLWHIDGIEQSPELALRKVDVVFSALKGEYGEDGKLQQVLDLFAKPFVGSKAYSTAMTQNKKVAKDHFSHHGIKTPYYKEFNIEPGSDIDPLAHELFRSFPMPVIVKPKGQGSSLGVSYASNIKELIEAIQHARGFSQEILVEEYLTGKEIISGFIDDFRGSDIYHMFPVEIQPHMKGISEISSDFATVNTTVDDLSPAEKTVLESVPNQKHNIFDFASKVSGSYDHKTPANLTQKEKDAIQHAVHTIRKEFGLRHFATADFIVHPRRGVYLLEINTHPHLHEKSPIYKSLDASGIQHHEFLEHLLRLALEGGK